MKGGSMVLPLIAGLIFARSAAAAADPGRSEKPIRVLFIGHSFVYYNNLPAMVTALARSTGGPAIETEMIVKGGASLRDHWEGGKALAAIRDGRWDFVVLVEQSTFGRVFLVNGRHRVGSAEEFRRFARLFARETKSSGAKAVLLDHWKDRDAPERDQSAIDHACMKLGRELDALVVPGGTAFTALQVERPSLALFDADGHHPSPLGSYLIASLLHSALLGRPPLGGAGVLEGRAVDHDSGELSQRVVVLVSLAPDVAESVQRIAWETVQELREHGGYQVIPLPPIRLPRPPVGQSVDCTRMVGTWKGPIDLYPDKGVLELRISGKASAVIARPTITFGGRPDDIRIEPVEVNFDGRRLSFVDPRGPNGSRIHYSGVLDGARLAGTAEMKSADDTIYGIGEWQLTRQSRAKP